MPQLVAFNHPTPAFLDLTNLKLYSSLLSKEKTATVWRANSYRQYCQHNRAGLVREGKQYARAVRVAKVHASAPPDEGATMARGNDNALDITLVVATVGDTPVGGEVVVGDAVTATGGDDEAL